ncbi:MAG: NAD(P)-dependent oxidoreductase [Candidatus Rokubacteria bacterium]|nr:NAD(P)-dependent oxidoreductase [Candidatus Rokubacteria bacterium]
MATRIGFVGLGAMGGNMARRLAGQGFTVAGYDVSAANAKRSGDAGVKLVGSPAEAADGADVVCSSLPDPATIRRAYLGPDGVLTRVRAGAALMDMSTTDPATWREVATAAAAKGVAAIDAPVSGGPKEAGNGGLVFIVGGTPEAVAQCTPVLDALGSAVNHVGPLGSGLIVKLVNNVMSMCNVVVAAEAMVLGVKAGIPPQQLFEILSQSGGRSHHFLKRFPNVLAGDFSPNFSIGLSRKDLGLALDMAADLGVPMLAASVAKQVYEAAKAAGLVNEDMAAVTKVYEGWAGVQVREKTG